MNIEQLVDQLTEVILIERGYDRGEKYDVEWDSTNPDSQFSMVREDMVIAVRVLTEWYILKPLEA
jgi:hypothetical protein